MKTVGLTGGIGSGKSTAAGILADLGAYVIDADRVGHSVYEPGTPGWQQVVAAFGDDILGSDGTIDRKRLGGMVFSDAAQLARLNGIVHPLIRTAVGDRISELRRGDQRQPVVVEAAVLLEAGWDSLVDEVWVIVTNRSAVVERVKVQRGLDAAAIEARIAAQLGDAERRRRADVVIDNSGDLDQLRADLASHWQQRLAPV